MLGPPLALLGTCVWGAELVTLGWVWVLSLLGPAPVLLPAASGVGEGGPPVLWLRGTGGGVGWSPLSD